MTSDIISKQTVAPEKYTLVKEQYAKGLTDNEFQVFLELANRYGLDPFARQIWAVKGYGNTPAQIIVARDGYLAIAHRSGQFDGMSDPEYTYDDKGKVVSVKVRVYRKDMTHPFTGEAWDDEDNLHQSVWNKRQRTMLLKVAESRALRKAFSISGTYCPEEMGYDENTPYKVQPKETDITVEPVKTAPAPAPMQTHVTANPDPAVKAHVATPALKPEPAKPVANPTCKTVTVEEVNLRYLPIYFEQKLDTSVFAAADLGNGKYDLDMITADYKRQKGLTAQPEPQPEPAPAPAPEVHTESGLDEYTAEIIQDAASKQTKPSAALSGNTCEKCGKKLLENEVVTSQKFCDGHLFCEEHRLEYVGERMAAKKTSKKGGSQ